MKQALTGEWDGKLVLPHVVYPCFLVYTIRSPLPNMNGSLSLNNMGLQKLEMVVTVKSSIE